MKYYVVDAFAEHVFEGNPAGVCLLEQWPTDELMQKIAMENNLSETAFAVEYSEGYQLRWFTPGGEIDLCGHATLATAYVIMRFANPELHSVSFETASGTLTVTRKKDLYEMDFPTIEIKPYELRDDMIEALGIEPNRVFIGRDLIFQLESEDAVRTLSPNFEKLKQLPEGLAAFVTSGSDQFDFVARAFWPKLGVNEDPVCGSMFCSLLPYWQQTIHKDEMIARQVSPRGGTVYLKSDGNRIKISGSAVLYSIADILVDE